MFRSRSRPRSLGRPNRVLMFSYRALLVVTLFLFVSLESNYLHLSNHWWLETLVGWQTPVTLLAQPPADPGPKQLDSTRHGSNPATSHLARFMAFVLFLFFKLRKIK